MSVYIVQMLCPARHAILAAAFEAPEELTPERRARAVNGLRAGAEAAADAKIINPYCDICRAPFAECRFEVERSQFPTLAEAMPALKEVEAANLATNAAIRAERKASQN